MIDAHVHLEKGDYSIEWIVFLEHTHTFTECPKGLYRLYRKIKAY